MINTKLSGFDRLHNPTVDTVFVDALKAMDLAIKELVVYYGEDSTAVMILRKKRSMFNGCLDTSKIDFDA